MPRINIDKWLDALAAALEEAARAVSDDGKITLVEALAIAARFLRAILASQ